MMGDDIVESRAEPADAMEVIEHQITRIHPEDGDVIFIVSDPVLDMAQGEALEKAIGKRIVLFSLPPKSGVMKMDIAGARKLLDEMEKDMSMCPSCE